MYRKILIASNGSDEARRALIAGFELASDREVELHMISVSRISAFPASLGEVDFEVEAASHRLGPVAERARKLAALRGLKLECHLLYGELVPTIVNFLGEHGFDLLIVGAAPHSILYSRLVGSTTTRLVDLSPCAVLVAK
jgi:nucleotide-binding universal stress UspA family protein